MTGNTRTGLGQETFLGRVKDVNYAEVVWALLYHGTRPDDQRAIETAARIFTYASTQ